MPQIVNLDDQMTVFQNLSIYAQLYGLNSLEAKKNCMHWAEILDFSNLLKTYPKNLSYGNQRKILFARSLLHNPEILLLDEPTTGMDPQCRSKVWNVIDKIQKHKTIIFATQNFSEAERYADRIAILHEGDIKMDGNLDRLIETTHGLTRYSLVFSDTPPEQFMLDLEKYPRIRRPKLSGLELEFYSRERKQFFNVLKLALEYDLADMDTSICSLRDLYLGLTDGGLE
jgi:ABC-type multidrug transport system ATPase subunit